MPFMQFISCNNPFVADELADPKKIDDLVPGKPVNVQASDGIYDNRIMINWNAVKDAFQYEVLKYDQSGKLTATYPSSDTEHEDIDIIPTLTYSYRVKALTYPGYYKGTLSDSNTGYRTLNASLIPFNTWVTNEITKYDQWFYFNATVGSNYWIYGNDSSCIIHISVFKQNLEDIYFTNRTVSLYTPLQVLSDAVEQIYIRIKIYKEFNSLCSYILNVTNN